jgi:Tol biopolymer transport system component
VTLVRYQSTLALMLLCAALALASAPAAFAQNEIAYRCDLDICLLDPANPGAVTNLTDNDATSYDEKPIWSPDGTKVAFVSDFTDKGHGEKNVFVMPAAGSGDAINLATQISDFPAEGKAIDDLAWSPDGSRIAFTRGNNAGDDKIWVENADGTSVFPLEIGGGGAKRHPSWSPDSSKIVYAVVKNEPEQIYIASSLGGFGQPLANGQGHEPNWSPSGSKIAFDDYNSGFGYVNLDIVNADGTGTPQIVVPSPYTEWTFSTWSPDGGRIAYRATAATSATVYRVTNADGSGDHPLASPGEGDPRYASWSPDGSRIVYGQTPFPNTGASDLYLVNADGSGGAQPLTGDGKSFDPAWRVVTAAAPGQPPGQGPGQGSGTPQLPPPHPGAKKPKVVWITKRIFVSRARPVPMMNVFCGAPDCGANSHATGKVSRAAGLSFRPALAKPGKKAKQVLVGKGKLHLTEGQTKTLYLRLNRAGWTLLEKQGKLTIHATVTIKSTGLASETFKKTLHLVFKKTKKTKR